MKTLSESKIWLIGGSAGIGLALTKKLLIKGAEVCISGRSKERLDSVCGEVQSEKLFTSVCDISSDESVAASFNEVQECLGHIDIVIINAAIFSKTDSHNLDLDECIMQMDVNYCGALRVLKRIYPYFTSRASGYIVGVSSIAGVRALPHTAAYGASKSALTYFLESLRIDLQGEPIEISIVHPGFVKTRLTDKNDFEMPFLITPEEAAHQICLGMERRLPEIHFPKAFTLIIKTLSLLPERVYRWLMVKFIRQN